MNSLFSKYFFWVWLEVQQLFLIVNIKCTCLEPKMLSVLTFILASVTVGVRCARVTRMGSLYCQLNRIMKFCAVTCDCCFADNGRTSSKKKWRWLRISYYNVLKRYATLLSSFLILNGRLYDVFILNYTMWFQGIVVLLSQPLLCKSIAMNDRRVINW